MRTDYGKGRSGRDKVDNVPFLTILFSSESRRRICTPKPDRTPEIRHDRRCKSNSFLYVFRGVDQSRSREQPSDVLDNPRSPHHRSHSVTSAYLYLRLCDRLLTWNTRLMMLHMQP